MFGRHQSGYLFPVLLCVKSLPSGFAGVMQKLHTNENFVLFCTKSGRVCGGSLDTLRLLGNLQSTDIDDGEVDLWKHVDEDTMSRLLKGYEEAASKPGDRPMRAIPVTGGSHLHDTAKQRSGHGATLCRRIHGLFVLSSS